MQKRTPTFGSRSTVALLVATLVLVTGVSVSASTRSSTEVSSDIEAPAAERSEAVKAQTVDDFLAELKTDAQEELPANSAVSCTVVCDEHRTAAFFIFQIILAAMVNSREA